MITKNNILTEYPKIKGVKLPESLSNEKFELVKEELEYYDDDATLKKHVDLFIEKLNEILAKSNVLPVKEVSSQQPAAKRKVKSHPKSNPETVKKVKKVLKKPAAKTKAPKAKLTEKFSKAAKARKPAASSQKPATITDREGKEITEGMRMFTRISDARKQAKKLDMKIYSMPDNIHLFVGKSFKEAREKAKSHKPKFRLKVQKLGDLGNVS